jgi:RNA polymerase sigma-54 factor
MEMIDVINQEMEENPLLEDAPTDEYEETERNHGSEEGKTPEREELKGLERTEEITGEGDGKKNSTGTVTRRLWNVRDNV